MKKEKSNVPQEFYQVKDIAQIFNVHTRSVYRWINRKTIPHVILERKPYVPKKWIDGMLEKSMDNFVEK